MAAKTINDSFSEYSRVFSKTGMLPRKVTGRLSEIASCSDEALATAVALMSYGVQKWAYEARKEIFGPNENLFEALAGYKNASFITKNLEKPCYQRSLENTEEIIKTVEEAIETVSKVPEKGEIYREVINHFHCGGELNSEYYYFNRYYSEAVEYIVVLYGKKFLSLLQTVSDRRNTFYELYDGDYPKLYHNTKAILKIYKNRDVLDYYSGTDDNALSATCKIMSQAIERLTKFKPKGERYYSAINQSYREWTNRKNSYYRYYDKSVILLSFILWGYSTRDIIRFFA